MVARASIQEIANRASSQRQNIQTEEATKNALVLPLIQALGYDVFNPAEVVPEFTADYGLKSAEKVDYAIIVSGGLVMLFECKKVGDDLGSEKASQLARYFANTPARIGVLTDGVIYRFFSDLDHENIMDTSPFFEINLAQPDDRGIQALEYYTKNKFDLEQALAAASTLRYIAGMKSYPTEMLGQPSEDFVRLLTRQVFSGALSQPRMERFSRLAYLAFHEFVNDRISDTLRRASDIANSDAPEPEDEPGDEEDEPTAEGPKEIVTTAEEIAAYELIKVILGECVAPARVAIRDTQTYCAIVLDGDRLKTICRLFFSKTRKRLAIMDPERDETGKRIMSRFPLESVNDIASYSEVLKAAVMAYLE